MRTTVARMKIKTEGITSGKLHSPVSLFLRIIMPTDVIKRVIAIPSVKFVFSSSIALFIVQVCSPYATLAIRLPNKNEGILAGGLMSIRRRFGGRILPWWMLKYVLIHHWLTDLLYVMCIRAPDSACLS